MFDIDGVLVRGSAALPGAKHALERLRKAHVPFVLLTNSGGITEAAKARLVSHELGLPISPSQVIMCYSPVRELVPSLQHKHVLVLGSKDYVAVARDLGFKHPVTVDDLCADDPGRHPFFHYPSRPMRWAEGVQPGIAAVVILHDPIRECSGPRAWCPPPRPCGPCVQLC